MKSLIIPIAIAACFYTGCKSNAQPFTEKRITIASKETVKVKELGMTITNNGCGRKWISKGDEPSYERAYCEIVIERDGKTFRAGNDAEPVLIGDVRVEIDRMNPWGAWEDSVPPGGCRLWIRKTIAGQ